MMTEAPILNYLRVGMTKLGGRLFRNNTGKAWAGKFLGIKMINGKRVAMIENPRVLHAGLCIGSSDLIGWMPVTITKEMVGSTVAVFTAVEVKTEGVATTEEQKRFTSSVTGAGGFGLLHSPTVDALDYLKTRAAAARG
jgi:hypothetical protein